MKRLFLGAAATALIASSVVAEDMNVKEYANCTVATKTTSVVLVCVDFETYVDGSYFGFTFDNDTKSRLSGDQFKMLMSSGRSGVLKRGFSRARRGSTRVRRGVSRARDITVQYQFDMDTDNVATLFAQKKESMLLEKGVASQLMTNEKGIEKMKLAARSRTIAMCLDDSFVDVVNLHGIGLAFKDFSNRIQKQLGRQQ